ncbi:MAG: Kelch repeat-containing protein [Aquabacterium sp.]
MPVGLAKFGAAAVGTRVFTAGGYDTLRTALQFDTATGAWTSGPVMPNGSDNLAVAAVAGRVHAIGGEARTVHQIFDPVAGSWSIGPASPRLRFASSIVVLDGRLHLIGGWNGDNGATGSLTSHDVYDPVAGTWSSAAALTTARNAAGAAVLDGRIVVIGGRAPGIRAGDQTSLASCEIYDPALDRWTDGPALPQARAGLAAVTFQGRIYAFGGESSPGGVRASVTRLDALAGGWTAMADMPWGAHGLAAVVVNDGIQVMGGFTGASDAVGTESRQCWRYVPVIS